MHSLDFGPDSEFSAGMNINHEDANREFPQLTAYPSTFPGEQSQQAGISTHNWKEEELEMGNDSG